MFAEIIDFLHSGDVLVLNDSRVLPARLRGVKAETEGGIEILLLEEVSDGVKDVEGVSEAVADDVIDMEGVSEAVSEAVIDMEGVSEAVSEAV